MSLPPLDPNRTASGIALDPRTLERVVPETKRADGSVRKEIRIRPGFTPQEDVSRFRGSRQQQVDRTALPKGHILGWVAPSSEGAKKPGASTATKSKSAKKNEKKREKKREDKERIIKENWEDDDDEVATPTKAAKPSASGDPDVGKSSPDVDELADTLSKTNVKP